MSISVTGYTEAKIDGRWYCIDFFQYDMAGHVHHIVHGTTSSAKISTIKKLCDGLDISVRRFFDSPLFDDLEQELK